MEIKDFVEFPRKMTEAIVRGIGRLISDITDPYRGNPYIDMTPEQRLEIEEKDRL